MARPISKQEYKVFMSRRQFASTLYPYSSSFIKVFSNKGLLTVEQIDRIKYLAKRGTEADVKAYVEGELVQGGGNE